MIDKARWLEALRVRLGEDAEADFETAGFHIPQHGSLVLHEEETTSLIRLVSEEAAHDAEELTMQAQRLDEYAYNLVDAKKMTKEGARGRARDRARDRASAEGGALPLYASATPNGRLVANFCAASPFDETDEALATLDRFFADNPLGLELAR